MKRLSHTGHTHQEVPKEDTTNATRISKKRAWLPGTFALALAFAPAGQVGMII